MPPVALHSTHLTRTTFHCVPHSEQVQKRVLCAFGQPTTAAGDRRAAARRADAVGDGLQVVGRQHRRKAREVHLQPGGDQHPLGESSACGRILERAGDHCCAAASGGAARTASMASQPSAAGRPSLGRACRAKPDRWLDGSTASDGLGARADGGMPCSSAWPIALERRQQARGRQSGMDVVLGLRQPREEFEIGLELVPGRQGREPLRAG